MPRTKLREQPVYEFHYGVTLQSRDINYGGHLGNDALVTLIGEARVNLLRILGCSEGDLGDRRTAIIMTDLVVNYRGEGFLFDVVCIDTHVGELSRHGFRLFHRVTRDDTVLALAETGFMAFDYQQRKIATLPDTFIRAVAGKGRVSGA